MGIFGRNIEESYRWEADPRIDALEEDLAYARYELAEAREELLKVADAFDNIGWAPLAAEDAKEIKLETVKKIAVVARGLYSMNPFVQRGVNARIGYIWGRGVNFDGLKGIADKLEEHRDKLFNSEVYAELERTLATDGNAFIALPVEGVEDPVFRVPLDQIMSAVSNPNDVEDVWFYRREWEERRTNGETGEVTTKKFIKYYPSVKYRKRLDKQGKNLPRRFRDVGVEQKFVIHHAAVNKQVGWRWGVPDILPVIFWAKAYKEYLEDNALLVKAYNRLAWSIQAPNGQGAQQAGAQVLAPPTRDPMTGELRNVGGTAVMGGGMSATPVAPTGSQVDFNKGSALAAAIASGLQVSKVVITSDPGEGNRATAETLDLPTLKAMEARQQFHTDRFLQLFEFFGAEIAPLVSDTSSNNERDTEEAEKEGKQETKYALVSWPQIESDSTKDRIAALGTAVELGVLFKQEGRKDALDTLGIAPYKPWDQLPTMEDDPAAKEKFEQAQMQADQQFEREQSVIAKQGVQGGIAAKGGGQSTNNQARDNRAADSKSK